MVMCKCSQMFGTSSELQLHCQFLLDTLSLLQDGKGGGDGFEVQKYGDGRVALIGESFSYHPLLQKVNFVQNAILYCLMTIQPRGKICKE